MPRKLLCLAVSLGLLSCATTFNVKVLRPSAVSLGPVRKLAILDFPFRGEWDFQVEDEEPASLEERLVDLIGRQIGAIPPPPPPPDPLDAYPGRQVAAKFIDAFTANGHYAVLERENIDRVLSEQGFEASGAIEEGQAVEIGKLLGVEALVIGSGTYSVRDGGMWEEHTTKDADGNAVKAVRYRAVRRVDVAITYRIIDATTGEVLASQSISRKNYRETGSGGRYEAFALHATKAEAIKRLPPWRPIVEGQVKELASAAVRYVAPHYVWRKRKVDKGKSPAMKAGLEYAKRGLWDEARESWESVLADRSEKARKDHVAARYNLGVYHEIHGNLDEAEECFDACFKATGKGRYLDARANIDARRRELQRLEQQLDSGGDGS